MTFDEFVNAELDGLISFSAALAGDRYLAEDILSDALVKVAVHWRRISMADDPAGYVRRVVVTTYLADRRKARRRTDPTSDLSILDRPATDQTCAVLTREEVADLIAGLPPQQKAVIVLRYLLDEPDDQIARALSAARQGRCARTFPTRALLSGWPPPLRPGQPAPGSGKTGNDRRWTSTN